MNTDDISAAIGKIMQNPEFAGLVRELRGENGDQADVSREMLAHLPEVMGILGPMLGNAEKPDQPEPAEKPREKPEPPREPPKRFDKTKAEKLMFAIKPYLKPQRCEIIDKCMSAMQLTDVIGVLKDLEGLNKPKT